MKIKKKTCKKTTDKRQLKTVLYILLDQLVKIDQNCLCWTPYL